MNDISRLSEAIIINKLGKIVDAVAEKKGIKDYNNKADNSYYQQFIELIDVTLGKEGTTIEAINNGTVDMNKVPNNMLDCLEALRCAILGKEWNADKYLVSCISNPSSKTDLLGKTVSELTTNFKIENGIVSGKLNYVYDYEKFSSNKDEQEGYFLPFKFTANDQIKEVYFGVVVDNRIVSKKPVKCDDLSVVYLGKTAQDVASREIVISAVREDGIEEIMYLELTSVALGYKKPVLGTPVAKRTISPASINEKNTLTDLIANCKEDNVVIDFTNNVNIEETVTIPEGKTVTLNLKGTVLNNTKGDNETIVNNGTLIINDKTRTSVIENHATGKTALLNNGNLSISGVTVKRVRDTEEEASFYSIVNRGIMTINGGTNVIPDGGNASLIQNGWYDGKENTAGTYAVLTINDGTFDGGLNTVKNDDWGIMTINGGIFTNQTNAVVFNVNDCTINGGIFKPTSEAKYCLVNWYLNDEYDLGIMKINGGTFFATGEESVILWDKNSAGKTTIKGGTFVYVCEEPFNKECEDSVIKVSASLDSEPEFATEIDEIFIEEGYIVIPMENSYKVAKA